VCGCVPLQCCRWKGGRRSDDICKRVMTFCVWKAREMPSRLNSEVCHLGTHVVGDVCASNDNAEETQWHLQCDIYILVVTSSNVVKSCPLPWPSGLHHTALSHPVSYHLSKAYRCAKIGTTMVATWPCTAFHDKPCTEHTTEFMRVPHLQSLGR
jgi:hypothetical protein